MLKSMLRLPPRIFLNGIVGLRGLSGPAMASANIRDQIGKSHDLTPLKLDSNGCRNLYAIFRLHNMPYLVTKGDRLVLPFKMKDAEVGDTLLLNDVTTLGSPEFTYNNSQGISEDLYDLKASVVEITKEPYYEVYRTKRRNRRVKTFPVQNYQTILMISELKLT